MMIYVLHFLGYGFLGLIIASTTCLFGMALCDCVTSLTSTLSLVKQQTDSVDKETLKEEVQTIDMTEEDAAEVALITQLVESTAELSAEEDEEETEESDVADE